MSLIVAAEFHRRLLRWFDFGGRKDLPWQNNRSPYRVWLSEIMLQQTQVTTVIPYYRRFLRKYPNLSSLAAADINSVLELWSGLGYYARARNLHRAARMIVDNHKGRFPKDIESLVALPGIGRSTAGAILAFSHGQRHPILDGNVKRVLARMIALDQWTGSKDALSVLWGWSEELTPRKRVGDYTQAIMDLGATVCTRSRPDCGRCPVSSMCLAYARNAVDSFPVPKAKRTKPVRSAILLMVRNRSGEVLLEQRPPTGIWGGLWSFPEIDNTTSTPDIGSWTQQNLGLDIKVGKPWPVFVHRFSHYDLNITPLPARLLGSSGSFMETGATVWYNPRHTRDRGLARPVEKLLNELRNR